MIALLIRHGHTEAVGQWLAGRRAGLGLSPTGRLEIQVLATALRQLGIAAVYSSPLERAVDTARPLARDRGLAIQTRQALTDVDFGDWTGMSLDSLSENPEWQAFNHDRGSASPPGGEPLAQVQLRVMDELLGLSRIHVREAERVAIVTHAEPIRCAIAAIEGNTLDEVLALEISTAHVSTVVIGPAVRRVLSVNVNPEAADIVTSRPYN